LSVRSTRIGPASAALKSVIVPDFEVHSGTHDQRAVGGSTPPGPILYARTRRRAISLRSGCGRRTQGGV